MTGITFSVLGAYHSHIKLGGDRFYPDFYQVMSAILSSAIHCRVFTPLLSERGHLQTISGTAQLSLANCVRLQRSPAKERDPRLASSSTLRHLETDLIGR